ncbi:hypothetical protein HY389_01285 [Candidatus Daviesbacteria bacterium]|nr:hypothetical protein [Candidatus Daviesbacteria bacterium]
MTDQINHHLTANAEMKKRHIIVNNFLGGMAWGFGTVVGASIVVAIIFGILRNFNFIPLVGGAISGAANQVEQTKIPAR